MSYYQGGGQSGQPPQYPQQNHPYAQQTNSPRPGGQDFYTQQTTAPPQGAQQYANQPYNAPVPAATPQQKEWENFFAMQKQQQGSSTLATPAAEGVNATLERANRLLMNMHSAPAATTAYREAYDPLAPSAPPGSYPPQQQSYPYQASGAAIRSHPQPVSQVPQAMPPSYPSQQSQPPPQQQQQQQQQPYGVPSISSTKYGPGISAPPQGQYASTAAVNPYGSAPSSTAYTTPQPPSQPMAQPHGYAQQQHPQPQHQHQHQQHQQQQQQQYGGGPHAPPYGQHGQHGQMGAYGPSSVPMPDKRHPQKQPQQQQGYQQHPYPPHGAYPQQQQQQPPQQQPQQYGGGSYNSYSSGQQGGGQWGGGVQQVPNVNPYGPQGQQGNPASSNIRGDRGQRGSGMNQPPASTVSAVQRAPERMERGDRGDRGDRGGDRAGDRGGRRRGGQRSKSPSPATSRRKASSSPPRGRGSKRGPSPPTGSTSTNQPKDSSAPRGKIDFSRLSLNQIAEEYNLPILGPRLKEADTLSLNLRFPKLYVPADFVKLSLDWTTEGGIGDSLYAGAFHQMHQTVPMQLENTAKPLSVVSAALPSDAPKFTYCEPSVSSPAYDTSKFPHASPYTQPKPIKFNARVIISVGFKDSEMEKIDHQYTRKLRLLCGRRKGAIMLLGGAWCRELDGGDPIVDRSCLANTARRAVFAQSLLDPFAAGFSSHALIKLGEVHYHRPQEEIKGKVFPEQDEITVIFLCCVKPPTNLSCPVSSALFAKQWKLFSLRSQGKGTAPDVNENPFLVPSDFNPVATNDEPTYPETLFLDHLIHILTQSSQLDDSKSKNNLTENGEEGLNPVTSSDSSTASASAVDNSASVSQSEGESAAPSSALTVNTSDESKSTENKEDVAAASKSSPTSSATSATSLPSAPCVCVCPQPLASDIAADATRKQEGVSLRVLQLSAVLSYSLEDSNERIFEASIAAEMLRSAISVHFATIVTDFICAEHDTLHVLVSPVIKAAVKTLRMVTAKLKAHAQALADANAATLTNAASESKSKEINDEDDDTYEEGKKRRRKEVTMTKKETPAPAPAPAPVSAPEDVSESKCEDETTGTDKVVSAEEADDSGAKMESVSGVEGVEPSVVDGGDDTPTPMNEEAAREWKRTFWGACRWFDIQQKKYLSVDNLEMILHSSMREISRSDVTDAILRVANVDKFRYEAFL